MKKKAIYGHSGSQNHGNEAIVRGLHELFPDTHYEIFTFSYSELKDKLFKLDEIGELKIFCKPVSKNFINKLLIKNKNIKYKQFFKPFLKSIDKDTVYCLEAGDQYCEPGEVREWYKYVNKKIREKGAHSVMLGCSITKDVINTKEVMEDLKMYSAVIARETLTYNLLSEAGINAYLAPCPAFCMPAKKCLLPACFDSHEVIGFNIGFLQQGNEKYIDMLRKNYENAIRFIIDKTNYNVLLIPHVNWNYKNSDFRELEKLYAKYKNTNRVFVLEEKGAPEAKYILSKLKALVAVRTHVQIPALASYIPTIIAGYKHKSFGISNDIYGENSPYLAHVQSLSDQHSIKTKLEYLLNNYNEVKTYLKNTIPNYISKTEDIKNILENLK